MKLLSEDEFLQRALQVPLQPLQWELAKAKGVEVIMRRDDLIDDALSGNKFYKLFYNLHHAQRLDCEQLLSFGGAYSNHLYALAAAGWRYGFKTIGVVRGERPRVLSPTLTDAEAWGMQLCFVARADYLEPDALLEKLRCQYGEFFAVPEGGANNFGVQGAQVIGQAIRHQLKSDYTSVCLACGTGNTLAGVTAGLADSDRTAIGFSVLKGEGNLGASIRNQQRLGFAKTSDGWRLVSGYHAGGYAKKLPLNLREFNRQFEREMQLQLDPVYTLKMCWGVAQLLQQDYWLPGSRLVLIHTGGLQGRRGFRY